MGNKNNKKTMNKRTHNPLGTYQINSKEATNNHSNDTRQEEISAPFDAQTKKK